MAEKVELLAPGGDLQSVKAAIAAGANAVYCGLDRFNARNRAANLSWEELCALIPLAHKNNSKLFLTLNILIVETELPALISLLNKVVNIDIDGIIVQDIGLLYLLKTHFPSLKVHGSTQLTTHNQGQISFLHQLDCKRVNFCRELSMKEFEPLTAACHQHNMAAEVFVHGSHCISFSGLCYMSSFKNGNSGNRGRCSQPCRSRYQPTEQAKVHPLNLKDISAFRHAKELIKTGVDSVKIEGRIKQFHHVYSMVKSWDTELSRILDGQDSDMDDTMLYTSFNRDFSSDFLEGNIQSRMFSENIRDNAAFHLTRQQNNTSESDLHKAKKLIYDARTAIIKTAEQAVHQLGEQNREIAVEVWAEIGSPLKITIISTNTSFTLYSTRSLTTTGRKSQKPLTEDTLKLAFGLLSAYGYSLSSFSVHHLEKNVFLPASNLTSLKREVIARLNGCDRFTPPVETSRKKTVPAPSRPRLSVTVTAPKDCSHFDPNAIDIFCQLPEYLDGKHDEYRKFFSDTPHVIPLFPSILIGSNFTAAAKLLKEIQPEKIVTNNSGIAYHAWKLGIEWVAGPCLNITNSLTLECLQKIFNCAGAFISNELSRMQLKVIQPPKQLDLYYSIYHPLQLMTSRQCFFHQVSGCDKDRFDDQCLQQCARTASLIDMDGEAFVISKTRNNHNRIYSAASFLNLAIINDMGNKFTGFHLDLTGPGKLDDKTGLADLFMARINGSEKFNSEIEKRVSPATCTQYRKGI